MAENGLATAAIDLSDSLAKAVVELVSRSRVGAKIFLEQVPVEKKVGLKKALGGGDDFELLFAIPAKICREAEKKFRKKFSVPLTEIGVITQNPKVLYLKNGRILKPATENFQHF
jgi:thiamine-monophosphate kinase